MIRVGYRDTIDATSSIFSKFHEFIPQPTSLSFITFVAMQFLNPNILWFLGALIIPIIIHLFYFRRYKKVHFSDTRFLVEAKEVQRNASRLKHLLVLLARLLAIALIIFAFAQPFRSLHDQKVEEARHVSFFIDNSFSMDAGGQKLNLLEEAKDIAIRSIMDYPDHYSFHVFDHSFAGEDQQWIDREKAIHKLRRTQLTGQIKTMSQILGRQRQMKDHLDGRPTLNYVFSDGQENIFHSLPDFEPEERVELIRLKPVLAANIAIDSVWIEDPVILPRQATTVYVQLANYGTSPVTDVNLSFIVNEQSRPAGSFSIAAGEKVIDTLPVTFSQSGWQELKFKIEDEAVRFDDEMQMTVVVSDQIRVLLINENDHEPFFRAAVIGNKRSYFDRKNVQSIIYSDFPKYDLIVVDELKSISSGLATELNNYIRSGGNTLFIPARLGDIDNYNTFFKSLNANRFRELKEEEIAVHNINTSSYVFKNVYRRTGKNLKTPRVNAYFSVTNKPLPRREVLMGFRNRSPYITAYQRDAGNLYVCTSPSSDESSTLLRSGSFFVPMLHRMSTSTRRGILPYYVVGADQAITVAEDRRSTDPVYKLIGDIEVIPSRHRVLKNVNLYAGDQINESGIFDLKTQDSLLAKVAYNFDRSESDMKTYSLEELSLLAPEHLSVVELSKNTDLSLALVQQHKQTTFWKWCIIGALICLLIEQVLLRHFRG